MAHAIATTIDITTIRMSLFILVITYLFSAVTTINVKAPTFLQGVLQFELRLVGGGGLEPPTPCL